ncbi:hypothetical protein FRB95_002693 [Tulasnella sp. JGI-2019a]|nr:hypothetical protein FRB95_002693 [Tulasnella sp. JGI-2019a]
MASIPSASHPSLPQPQRDSYMRTALSVPPRPIGMQPGHPRYSRSPATGALPSPAVSQSSRPLSPGTTYVDHHEGSSAATRGGEGPVEWHSWSPPAEKEFDNPTAAGGPLANQPVAVSSRPPTPDVEPTAPDQSQIVMHHNGMGAKFTDVDSAFIREYFRWSMKHHPGRTNRQVLDCLHEKMPYHSAVSTAQYIRRHADRFPEYVKKDERVGPKKKGPAPSPAEPVDVELPMPTEPYDPALVGDDGCPLPPKSLIPFATGFRFTVADSQYVVAFFNWYLTKYPEATRAHILRELTNKASYRSLPSWSNFFHKNQEKWKTLIKGLRDLPEGDLIKEGSPLPRISSSGSGFKPATTKRRSGGSYSLDTPSDNIDAHTVNSDDAMRKWKPLPPRQHPSVPSNGNGNGATPTSTSNLPTPGAEGEEGNANGDYFDGANGSTFLPVPVVDTPSSTKPFAATTSSTQHNRQASAASSTTTTSSSRLRAQLAAGDGTNGKDKEKSVSEKPRRADFGTRRTSKPFTTQEKLVFIEFLADHPWVWSQATAQTEWLKGGTTASATWQKFEKIQPHRSDACWREYHKRNAGEFDAAAKRLRLARESGDVTSTAQTALAQGQMNHPTQSRSQREKGVMERYEEDYEAEDPQGDDYEDEDREDGVGYEEEEETELPGSSFSYAPIHIEPAYNEEDDGDEMIISEDEDDNGSHYGGNGTPATSGVHRPTSSSRNHHSAAKTPSTRGKGGSRRGRPYVPFSTTQAEKFAEFLVDHPQIWSAATPEEGWVPDKVMREGKDATWKLLAAMPGMDNHSFKSWREYHRVRAMQYDPIAKAARLVKEAARVKNDAPPAPPSQPLVQLQPQLPIITVHNRPPLTLKEVSSTSVPASEKTLVPPKVEEAFGSTLSPGGLTPRKRSREPTAEDEDYDEAATPERIEDGAAVKRLRVSEMLNPADDAADVKIADVAKVEEGEDKKMEVDQEQESKIEVKVVVAPAA